MTTRGQGWRAPALVLALAGAWPAARADAGGEAPPAPSGPEARSKALVAAQQRFAGVLGPCGRGEPCGDGLALAGGGTKAAAYAMGVLAAAVDAAEADPDPPRDEGGRPRPLGRIGMVSSVSGGGYASYFLYSKVAARQEGDAVTDFMADCLPDEYQADFSADALARLQRPGPGGLCASQAASAFRFQRFVRCRQDVLEQDCRPGFGGDAASNNRNAAMLIFGTAVSLVPNFLARTVFDWPVNLSVSRAAYKQGIGSAYGLYPTTWPLRAPARPGGPPAPITDIVDVCDAEHFANCLKVSYHPRAQGSAQVDPRTLTFDRLRQMVLRREMPLWIINATASRSRSIFGWTREGQRDFSQYTMHITPHGMYSGFHGDQGPAYLERTLENPLEAVVTAAAFFDANQTALRQPTRLLSAGLLHLGNLDWGRDIPNEQRRDPAGPDTPENRYVGRFDMALHQLLPTAPWPWSWWGGHNALLALPTYFADGTLRTLGHMDQRDEDGEYPGDSVYIRLSDGGNNDNTGAYAVVRAGATHVFISDHAQDRKGSMGDMCRLSRELGLRRMVVPGQDQPVRMRLVLPGLMGFDKHCKGLGDAESAPELGSPRPDPAKEPPPPTRPFWDEEDEDDKAGYGVHRWRRPVVVGCIVPQPDQAAEATKSEAIACDLSQPGVRRVYLLKPAIDLPGLMPQGPDGLLPACPGSSGADCDAEIAGRRGGGMAEVAAYLKHHPVAEGGKGFPQHGTVSMTFASDAARYGAYRELARHQMGRALQLRAAGDEAFRQELACQRGRPQHLSDTSAPDPANAGNLASCDPRWGW